MCLLRASRYSKFEDTNVKKPLNLDKKFAELTINKDSIARDLKLNRRLLYRNHKLFIWC